MSATCRAPEESAPLNRRPLRNGIPSARKYSGLTLLKYAICGSLLEVAGRPSIVKLLEKSVSSGGRLLLTAATLTPGKDLVCSTRRELKSRTCAGLSYR